MTRASSAASKAADNIGDWTVSNKYLAGADGNYRKWVAGVDVNGTVAGVLRSRGASLLPNAGSDSRFIVQKDVGSIVGTRGETVVKAVVADDGHVLTAYPVK